MSRPKANRTSWLGWAISAVLIIGSLWLWTQRQYVVDAIQYYQFTPSDRVRQVAEDAGFTDDAMFTFYATRPVIESSATFNDHCERREADSPILGCYSANRIYIFDITDERLEGIKVVTAAHELLHAEYERLPNSEKERIDALLEKAYQSGTNPKLEERMAYYEKTQPGQNINELHSIVGTEFASIDSELEAYYARFFKDRQALVALHDQVERQFESLSEEADELVAQIEGLARTINDDTKRYNDQVVALNDAVEQFNSRASRSGGFTTQAEFQAARQDLLAQSNSLAAFRQTIQANIAQYKTLISKLDSINAESASLNQSLDSTLSEAPSI
jgi:hypothetical protein